MIVGKRIIYSRAGSLSDAVTYRAAYGAPDRATYRTDAVTNGCTDSDSSVAREYRGKREGGGSEEGKQRKRRINEAYTCFCRGGAGGER
jgi:hypothetical protein